MKHRQLEYYKENLISAMESYQVGDCDLEAVMYAADKFSCYQQNVGINLSRLEYNEREKAFHDQWLEENAPVPGLNSGHGILQDLFIERKDFTRTLIEEMSARDRRIVATVIQWLGSNVGMCFLSEGLKRFGASIVYNSKSSLNLPTEKEPA